jgi:hypothetical protein
MIINISLGVVLAHPNFFKVGAGAGSTLIANKQAADSQPDGE